MKAKLEESLIFEGDDYNILAGNLFSETKKENIYYKKARPHQYSDGDIFHIIIIHDLFEYHQRHLSFLKYMSKRYKGRLEITWIDLLGHGLSAGTRGHIDNFDELTLSIVELLNQEHDSLPNQQNRKNILFGQGLGGLIILDLIMNFMGRVTPKVHGLIFSNPDIFLSKSFPNWSYQFLGYAGHMMGSIRIPSPLKGEDLTDNPKEIESYNSDPLINHFCSLAFINQILIKSKSLKGSSYFIDTPSLFLLSDKDVWGDPSMTELFAKGMPKKLKTLYIYQNTKRELANSEISDKVFYDIFSWLTKLKD